MAFAGRCNKQLNYYYLYILMSRIVYILITTIIFLPGSGFVNVDNAHSAFHTGGTASCNGCHVTHDANIDEQQLPLLIASDPSSVCLKCHSGSGGANTPSVYSGNGSAKTPGGDFYWLTLTYIWADGSSAGERHGHNVIAADFNLSEDQHFNQSPGGNYPSSALGCTSCHDPHGKTGGGTKSGAAPISVSGSYGESAAQNSISGNYRLLGDSEYQGGAAAVGFQFTDDAPVARQNPAAGYGESDASHVDYGSGMSEWCGNCHQDIVQNNHTGYGSITHISSSSATLGSTIASMYNSYINTGDLVASGTGTGNINNAYLQFVPFERGTGDAQQLNPTSQNGPDSNATVMCLTCHRAHASAFDSIGRWDLKAVLLVDSHPAADDNGVSGSDVLSSYYGRNIASEFGSEQGPLCEKCHGLSVALSPTGAAPASKLNSDPLSNDPWLLQNELFNPLLRQFQAADQK